MRFVFVFSEGRTVVMVIRLALPTSGTRLFWRRRKGMPRTASESVRGFSLGRDGRTGTRVAGLSA
jgi:hypothetical protein